MHSVAVAGKGKRSSNKLGTVSPRTPIIWPLESTAPGAHLLNFSRSKGHVLIEQTLPAEPAAAAPPGLRPGILSPVETLAQSISTIAPTTTPTMTIPLVFALAGNGTWLAYLFATGAVLLMALCISRFARSSSCSGSLYTYATSALPPGLSSVAGWALLLAYVATGASVTGGFINY